MKRYVDFILKYRKALIILLLIVNVVSFIGLFKIKIDTDFDIFILNESPEKERYYKMLDEFPDSEDMIVMLEFESKEMSKEEIKIIFDFVEYLEENNDINYINTPIPDKIPINGKMLNVKEEDIDSRVINDYFSSLGEFSPITLKNDKVYISMSIFPNDNFDHEDIKAIELYLEDNNISYYLSGDIYLQKKILDYISFILLFIPPLALFLILFVFRTQMKSFRATFFSILPAGIGALWTMGILGWSGKEVSIITVLAPIFTIVIGSADGLHFVSHVQEGLIEGKNKVESIIDTLRIVGIPMIITTLTSIVGFLSLLVLNNDAIKTLAFFSALGILLAGVATWYIVPVILSGKIELPLLKKDEDSKKEFLKKLWGVPSIVLVGILLVISFLSINNIKNEFNLLMLYKENTEVSKSFNKVMEINDGCTPIFILIETDENPTDFKYADRILDLEENLKNTSYTNKVISLYDLYSNANKFLFTANERYPQSIEKVKSIEAYMEKISGDMVNNLIKKDKNLVRLMLFPTDLENDTLKKLEALVEQFDNNYNDMNVTVTGAQYLMYELNLSILDGQNTSMIIAMTAIFILLLLSLKKLKPAIAAIIPILITSYVLSGFLGISSISLNLITVTIFSVTLGVGVDYAIHFTSVWMSCKKEGYSSEEATNKAFKYSVKPILANALGLSIGFSALLLSPLKIHMYISQLMWVSMVISVLLSLTLLPTILKRINIKM